MAQLVIIRPLHFLPGREQDVLRWAKKTEDIRRRAGMVWQASLRNTVDRDQYVLVQVWESKEAYARWKTSPDRARLARESSKFVFHDPTQTFETMHLE